jgi:exonuclease VII small subunit
MTPARGMVLAPLAMACFLIGRPGDTSGPAQESLIIRGHVQALHLYGSRGGTPAIVSSGDGGWIHLGPHVAEVLASRGFFVVGVDVKAYLESFTTGSTALRVEDEPGDFGALIEYATRGVVQKPVLIGVSEGAGLSVLAATDERMKHKVAGVIGLGLADLNELGWRWKDSVIYLTHGAPNEPAFSAGAIVNRMSPVPLALIHSTHDEYVPLDQAIRLFERADQPKRLWTVKASNHRFSDNLPEFERCLLEAIEWVHSLDRGGAPQ